MKLFVGLGNPGAEYARQRHNVGFMALDKIADAHGFSAWRKRFQGETAEGTIGGERVVLLKPMTYMNESGRSVGEAARFLKIPVEDIYVFHDEIDLAPAKLKVKTGGGNAGHNGLRSITAHMGNEYHRVRIGVGHPGAKDAVAHYVLHDFAKVEYAWLDPMLDAVRFEIVRQDVLGEVRLALVEVAGQQVDRQQPAPFEVHQDGEQPIAVLAA